MTANLLEFLYQALSSKFGVALETYHPKSAKQVLYRARKDSGDPELDKLSIRSGPGDEVWVVRQEK